MSRLFFLDKLCGRLRSRRGSSLVEVVVTLAIVGIIMAVASSITLSSVSAQTDARLQTQANECAYNVVECFRFADNQDDFISALQTAYPDAVNNEDGTYSFQFDNVAVTVGVQYNSDNSYVTVTASYGEGKTVEQYFKK